MSVRRVWLTLLLVAAAGIGTAHANKRERRQAGGACVTSDGRAGSCLEIRSCPALDLLLQQAKRGQGARGALTKLRQETIRCPFTRTNPLVCCEAGGGGGSASRQETQRPQFVNPTRRTTRRPQFVNPTRRTTRRPQFVSPTRRTTRRPQFVNPTRRTTRRPQFVSPTRRTTRRPQFVNPTRRTTRRPQSFSSSGALTSALPGEDQCGRRVFSSRIFGGQDAEIGSWPWAASVGYRGSGGQGIIWGCGATLITAQHVVTAGHCVSRQTGASPSVVRLGELDFSIEPDCLPQNPSVCADRHQDIAVASVVPHSGYQGSSNAYANDIALIRLARSVRFTEFVRPICLPLDLSRLQSGSDSNNGQKVFAVGWGRSEDSAGSFTPHLQETELRVVPASDCEQTYRRSGVRSLGQRLCVTGAERGSDTCRGDSGGPLMVPDQFGTRWFLTGITSFGPRKCGTKQAVYTRVHDYVDWIRSNLR